MIAHSSASPYSICSCTDDTNTVIICPEEYQQKIIKNNSYCRLLINSQGSPFEECLKMSDIYEEEIIKNCEMDVCASINDTGLAHEVACQALAALAALCELINVPVDWRDAASCRESTHLFIINLVSSNIGDTEWVYFLRSPKRTHAREGAFTIERDHLAETHAEIQQPPRTVSWLTQKHVSALRDRCSMRGVFALMW